MVKCKTFTSQLKIFHIMDEIDQLDSQVNDFLSSEGIKEVISVSDAVSTGSSGETIGLIRVVTYQES